MKNKDLLSIKEAFARKENSLIFETFSADTDTPVSLFLKYFENIDDSFLLDIPDFLNAMKNFVDNSHKK